MNNLIHIFLDQQKKKIFPFYESLGWIYSLARSMN